MGLRLKMISKTITTTLNKIENLGYSLFQSVEKTKVELSSLPVSQFQYSKMDIEINDEVSIDQYNGIIQKDIKKISAYLDDFLLNHQIAVNDIDSLFLTGGTSMVAAIKDLFKTKFPNTPVHSGDNFISVAKGLAYSGYLFEE